MGAGMADNSEEYTRLVCDSTKVERLVRLLCPRVQSEVTLESAAALTRKPRLVIVPGNGCTNTEISNWYAWARDCLRGTGLFEEVVLPRAMPDPYRASETIWLKYLREVCHVDDVNTIVVGHSSGAVAAMRLLENTKLIGAVLVAACCSHVDPLLG